MIRKGILLAGGSGTRLHPTTLATSKQLLPIYDKPMIYYSLSTLMSAGIKEILLISTPQHIQQFQHLLKDGRQFGINICYAEQPKPEGIAQAFLIGEKWIDGEGCALALGDNILHGEHLAGTFQRAARQHQGATVFAYTVNDPWRYGVVEFDSKFTPTKIIEKPSRTYNNSNWAVTGLYFYDRHITRIAKSLKPSERGELEITDINNVYLYSGKLTVERLGRGTAWLDAGTPDSLLQASNFVQTLQARQGYLVGSPEETATSLRFITPKDKEKLNDLFS